jgi:hypothetical protein
MSDLNKLHECKRGLATATPADYNAWWREMERLSAENKRLRWFADLCRERIGEQHDIPWDLAQEWLEDSPVSNRQENSGER